MYKKNKLSLLETPEDSMLSHAGKPMSCNPQ